MLLECNRLAETMPRPFKSYQLLFGHDNLWIGNDIREAFLKRRKQPEGYWLGLA